MVQEYVEKCYGPSTERYERLTLDHLQRAGKLADWRKKLSKDWGQKRVEQGETAGPDPMRAGAQLEVQARVNLGSLPPDDVEVQLSHGLVDNLGEIPNPATASMSHNGSAQGTSWLFLGKIPCRASGQY